MQDTPPITISALLDAYIAERKNPHAYRRCKWPHSIEGHLVAVRREWGAWTIDDFAKGSKARVKAKVLEWLASGTARATCRKRIAFLRTAFRFAISEELITRNQEPVMELPPPGPPRERFLDEASELPALLRAADQIATPDHIRLLLELALRTGQRRGAILALRWDLVDFDKRVIRFRDTETAEERSKKRRGDKPMDDALLAIMKRAHEARDERCDHVITWRGKAVRSPYAGMRALYKRAGLKAIHTHDLRRTSATYVHNESGGNIDQAASHIVDTAATARKHYVQEDPRVHMPAMQAVAGVLDRARRHDRPPPLPHGS